MVGTMQNLVNEVLQSAVGNYFRNKLQTLGATEFIEKRDEVQSAAERYIQQYLSRYEVETRGVYIQDVVFPEDLVKVLTSREIAAQERATFAQQRDAQVARVSLEQQRGVADMQSQLAQANVSIDIEKSKAEAARARAEGEAAVITTTGAAEAHPHARRSARRRPPPRRRSASPGPRASTPSAGRSAPSRRRSSPRCARSAPGTSRSSPTSRSAAARAGSSAGSARC